MRHIYGILTTLTALLLLAACTADGTDPAPQQTPATQLLLEGTILTGNSPVTRVGGTEAIQNTHLDAGNRVGGFIYRHGTDAKETTGEKYGYTNYPFDTWQANYLYNPNQPLFPVQGAERRVDIYAYAPYVDETVDASYATLNTAHTFTVKTDQTKRADFVASDLLWGYRNDPGNADADLQPVTMVTPITAQNQIVPIKFSHMLSQVYVEISAGDGVTTDQLEGAEVKLNGVTLDGTLNFKTGALTCGTTTGTVKVLKCGYKYDTNGNQVLINKTSEAADYAAHFKGAAIVYPVATLPTTVTLTVTTSANTFTAQLKTSTITSWLAGKKYQYQVRVSADGISFSASIGPWDTSEPDRPVTPLLQ